MLKKISFILLFLFHPLAEADPVDLKNLIETFVISTIPKKNNEDILIQIDSINAEIEQRLGQCAAPLNLSFPPGLPLEKNSVVSVSCEENPNKQVYIPFRFQILTPVLVAQRKIFNGETLRKSDLRIQKIAKAKLFNGYFKSMKKILGMAASKTIPEGTPINPNNIKKIALIKRNQPVTLLLKKGNIIVSMLGIAKSEGYLNDPIEIINPSSKKVIDAVTSGYGEATIYY